MDLFQSGEFTLHSGAKSTFKIDCDALSDKAIEALAIQIAKAVPSFWNVFGIPRGGLRLGRALDLLAHGQSDRLLIVDDVLTTGRSMEEYKQRFLDGGWEESKIFGVVIFQRGPSCPSWVTPIFPMNAQFAGL